MTEADASATIITITVSREVTSADRTVLSRAVSREAASAALAAVRCETRRITREVLPERPSSLRSSFAVRLQRELKALPSREVRPVWSI